MGWYAPEGGRIIVAFFATAFWGMGVRGLHNLEINVPPAVLVSETVTLECSWQLEDEEALYSVKWYRGREEFYRYIPKELPHTRVFPLPGIEVDISRSGARRVVLQEATPAMAGRFRCEVSADAPTFHTEIRSAPLEVVEAPEWGPKLVSDRSWYGVGSTLNATCASPPSHPPANLTFALNGQEIDMESFGHELPGWFKWDPPPKAETTTTEATEEDANFNIFHDDSNMQYLDESYINLHKEEIRRPSKESSKAKTVFERTGPDNRLSAVGDVSFVVQNEAFHRGSLRLTCIASIYNLYAARSELIFDMEQPEVASVLGVRNSALEAPEWGPKLVSDRSWYGVGSTLNATCASPPSHPPANLTFALNGQEIDMESFGHELPGWFKWDPPPKAETTTTEATEEDANFNIFHDDSNMQYLDESYINLHKEEIRRPSKESSKAKTVFERTGPDNRLSAVGDVSFVVQNEAFHRGSLRLTCIASIYNLYAARSELIFDMEQPEVASVLGVRNSALGHNYHDVWRIIPWFLPFIFNLNNR